MKRTTWLNIALVLVLLSLIIALIAVTPSNQTPESVALFGEPTLGDKLADFLWCLGIAATTYSPFLVIIFFRWLDRSSEKTPTEEQS